MITAGNAEHRSLVGTRTGRSGPEWLSCGGRDDQLLRHHEPIVCPRYDNLAARLSAECWERFDLLPAADCTPCGRRSIEQLPSKNDGLNTAIGGARTCSVAILASTNGYSASFPLWSGRSPPGRGSGDIVHDLLSKRDGGEA